VDFLGFTGQSAVIPALLEAVYDEDLHIQHRAAYALNDLPADEVLAAALQKLQERGPNPTLAEWLASIGAPVTNTVPLYLPALDSPDASARLGAVTGLGLCAGDPAVTATGRRVIRSAIKKALTDKVPDVRLAAVKALEESGPDDDAIAALAGAAQQDASSQVRERAAASLTDVRSGTVVPYLRELLLTDYTLQPDFAAQLREIGTPAALAALRDGLKSANPRVQAACAKQLWLVKDPAAKPTLLNVLRGDDADAQADVVDFLQDIARAQAGNAKPSATSQPAGLADWLEKQ
jgi:HEAT repeat protein